MKKILTLLILIILSTTNYYASHLVAGDITYTHVGGNKYKVTLTIYRDCGGQVAEPYEKLFYECGLDSHSIKLPYIQTTEVSQLCPNDISNSTCNGGTLRGTYKWVYSAVITLAPCTDWVMYWFGYSRNSSTNLGSGNYTMYIRNTLNNVVGTNNNSPQYFAIPTPSICANQLTTYNHGASDVDGDSLYYQLVQPLKSFGTFVANPPSPIPFIAGYSTANPVITSTGMNLNAITGEMSFTPTQGQICVVSVLISEYRKGTLIGTQIREMQIVVTPGCSNTPPYVDDVPGNVGEMKITTAGISVVQTDSSSISMCYDDNLCFEVTFTDSESDIIEVFANVAASIPSATFSVTNNSSLNPVGVFCWTPTLSDVGVNMLVMHAKDEGCPMIANQYYTYDITVNNSTFCATLPVTLVDFTGYNYKDATNKLVWTTQSEINNDYFIIQRSSNAQDFIDVGIVDGSGNSSAIINYSLIDDNPLEGINYYRLKQVDFNGHYEYSTIISIKSTNSIDAVIYPNPFKNNITIELPETNVDEVQVEIINQLSQIVYSSSIEIEDHKINLKLEDTLPKGIYLIKINIEGQVITKKILKA